MMSLLQFCIYQPPKHKIGSSLIWTTRFVFIFSFIGSFVYRFRGGSFRSRRRIWNLNWRGLPFRNFRITAINPNLNDEGEVANVYIFTGNVYYLFDDSLKRFIYPNQYPREVNRFILDNCLSS